MADFFKGLTGGFQTGLQLGQQLRQRRQEDELAKAYAKPEEFQDYTPEQMQEIQRLQSSGAYDVQAVPGAEGAVPTLRFAPRQGIELGQGEMLAAPTEIAPQRVQRYGGQTVAGQFDPTVLRGLQMREAAGVLGRYGDARGAAALEAQAEEQAFQSQKRPLELAGLKRQAELGDIQLTEAQRKQKMQNDFDTGYAKINEQKFEKPEERTAAILSLVEATQGVQARQQLESSYTTNELNQISLQSKKFDEGFRQSRAKGVIPALEWFDEQNTAFKLERDPKNPYRYIQVNTDGTRSVFADAKNERELGMIIDAKAKPGGWLELAKFELDQKKADDLAKYYRDVSNSRGATGLKQKVADFKEVYGRDPTEAEKGVLAGLVAKDPNKPEFSPEKYAATVKDFTAAGFSPTDALIKADQLYGRGPADASVDAGLQKANAAKGGPATPAKPAVGLTPQQMEKAAPAPQPARAPTTLDAIQGANLDAVAPLAAQFNQARTQFIQASQSGDPNAIGYYMNQQNALRQQLESEVSRRFGNNAPAVMRQLAGGM